MAWRTRGGVLGISAGKVVRYKKANNSNSNAWSSGTLALVNSSTITRSRTVLPRSTFLTAAFSPPQHQQCSSRNCCGSTAVPWVSSGRLSACSQRRSFCARSSERPSGDNEPLAVHVTHVDVCKDQAEREVAGAGEASEGTGTVGGAGDVTAGGGKPGEVRFLDVPGSEQTREEKMTIIFTCTVCETRTAKSFSKLSYEKGVVLARCPGCHNLHLIADRLGWFEDKTDGGWDLQKLQERVAEADCHMVTNDNIMELTLVDIMGKNTKQAVRDEGAVGAGSAEKEKDADRTAS